MQPITTQDPESRSADVVAGNVDKLRALFPELITEGAEGVSVNVDVLKELVGDQTVTDAEEKYGLNWHGKRRARQLALTPSTGTLRPAPEESVDWETTQNLMIEGDNLEVLKLLQKSYAGKVKLIYIDPPYNTGKDFVYPDDFRDSIRNYQEITGQVEGGASTSSNTETSGRFHTDWLNMLYPRLRVARDFLAEDGIVCISIDENEKPNLRLMCDSVFGEENFRNSILVRRRVKSLNAQFADEGLYSMNIGYEYILVYSKGAGFSMNALRREKDSPDEKGRWNVFWSGADRPTMRYEILGFKPTSGQWRWSKEKAVEAANNYDIYVKDYAKSMSIDDYWIMTGRNKKFVRRIDDGKGKNGGVQYWISPSDTVLRTTNWTDIEVSQISKDYDIPFDNPKSIKLMQEIVRLINSDEFIILDFFAGSGTTADAVMRQNSSDGGSRRFVLVQLPEPLDADNKDQEEAARYCDGLGVPRSLAELTKERLRQAAVKIRKENPKTDGDFGFRVFNLDSSNIRAWEPNRDDLEGTLLAHVEHLAPGRTEQDVLYELLLKLGLDLCVPIETREIAGKTVHAVGAGTLFVSLPDAVTQADAEPLALGIATWRDELDPAGDTTAVFRDGAFADDVAKTNVAAILTQHGVKTVRSL